MSRKKIKTALYFILLFSCIPVYRFLYKTEVLNKKYLDTSDPIILAGNHLHLMDIVHIVLNTRKRIYFLVKEFVFDYPVVGKIMRFFDYIKVLENRKNDQAMRTSVNLLRTNKIVGIFPEGRIKTGDEILQPFKFGAVKMARETGCKIVPFAFTGNPGLFSRNLKLIFGEPIDVKGMDVPGANSLLFDKVKTLIIENS